MKRKSQRFGLGKQEIDETIVTDDEHKSLHLGLNKSKQ